MAYDFSTLTKYDLNLKELRNYVLQNQFDFKYFDEWVNGWMNVFLNAEIDTLTQIQNLEKNGIPLFEVFVKEISFGKANFNFNFIVEGAKNYIKNSKAAPKKKSVTDFLNKVMWTEEESESTHEINDPVYLATLPTGNKMYLLIDGNTRVSQLLRSGTNEITYFDISPNNIIEQQILLFTIEKAIYAFLIESYTFQQHLKRGQYTHKDIFKSSNIFNAFKALNVK
ncbi:hypothetical protein [Sporosarcina sp. FSL K6-1508]|uniref:hypothetical protein n=1 Tax=Sporosarcina sp. FSL K6-1508 TaxID=2921553 RepID=UPI0030FB56B1